MADNVGITPGSGTQIATQDRSGIQFQQVIETGSELFVVGRFTATTTSAQAVAARANRKYVTVQSLITNTDTVDIGPSGVSAGSGFPLLPGDSIDLPTTAAIHADAVSGSQVLAYAEFYD